MPRLVRVDSGDLPDRHRSVGARLQGVGWSTSPPPRSQPGWALSADTGWRVITGRPGARRRDHACPAQSAGARAVAPRSWPRAGGGGVDEVHRGRLRQ